jgi:LDH2 family malate/lactate/ureidoglycolate dehydrogenase
MKWSFKDDFGGAVTEEQPSGPGERFPFERLETWATEVLVASGASRESADVTAKCCIRANRVGMDSHGVLYLDVYARRLRAGIVDGQARPEVVDELPGLALVDGHFALGAMVGTFAMEWCCAHAETNGAAAAVARNSSHFGAASYYSGLAVAHDCIGIALSNSDPGVAPAGALSPILGTNPLAIAAPPSGGVLPSLDMATSVAAQGRVTLAARRGEPIPLGWAIGPDGSPTVDPAAALQNAMLPAGGHKGFGLAFMIDVLSACLGGGAVSPQLVEERGASQLFVALRVGAVSDRRDYDERLQQLVAAVHDAPRADWAPGFLVPGERGSATAVERAESMTLDGATLALLRSLGEECGVPFPLPS